MFFIKLRKEILGPFNRTCHQLGIEHNIQGIDAKMFFCPIVAAVNFNDIAQTLKSVKGQSNGQNQRKGPNGIVPMKKLSDPSKIGVEKIEIFEDNENRTGGNNAEHEKYFPLLPFRF